jgi:nucleotide-binding universal stress UspA family protein
MPGLTALVPLDGTKLSESAYSLLPFARTLGIDTVNLVSVWEAGWEEHEHLPGLEPHHLHEASEKGRSYVEAYLANQANSVRSLGFEVETTVRIGKPAEEVLGVSESAKVDLIVIATHGRTGIARFRLGSVADRIIRGAHCPALVIGPNVDVELAPYALNRILVPLDGSALAEEALPIAKLIAGQTSCEIDLVRVVSLAPLAFDDQSPAVYSVDLLTAMEDAARLYLNRISQELGGRTRTSLLIGSADDQLLDYLKENPASLVIIASHARGGIARAALGSVTDRLLHGPAPVLVYRPGNEAGSGLIEAAKAATGR